MHDKMENPAGRCNAAAGSGIAAFQNDDSKLPEPARISTDPFNIPRTTGKIDFAGINRAALAALPAILDRWLPGGRREGPEYVVRNPRRADRRPGSFKVNLRSGAWADFATGDKGGDVVSLAAYLHGVGQADAARSLSQMLGVRHDG